MTALLGLNHVALTVRDVEVSGPWYTALLGADPAIDEHTAAGFRHLVWVLDDGTVFGIHQHDQSVGADRFSELRIGLDHIAFSCPDRDELQAWAGRLDELAIAHGPIVDVNYGSVLNFRDPDGIALEVLAPPAQTSEGNEVERAG